MSDTIYKKRGEDYAFKDNLRTLPGKYYTSKEIYEEELEKIFYKRWLVAGREEQIPNPGDYFLYNIGKESIIITRTKDGEVKAHFNVCRHRGTRMCTDKTGHFKTKSIRCPYHSWTYELDGALKSAHLMDLLKGFNKEDHSLYQAPARIWQGFIFINLSEDPIPFEDDLAPLLNKWEDKKIHELRIAHKVEYHLKCNWKLILQNYQECYHCPGVHPLLSKLTPYRSAVHDCAAGGIIGGYMSINEPGGSMTMDGKAAAPLLGNIGENEQQKIYYYSIYPNMLLTPHPDYVLYHVLTPISYNEVQLECHWLFHPDVINSADYKDRIRSAIEFWDMTNKQDWEVCEQMQQGVASARFDRGYYAGQEDMLAAIDQETLRSLGHDDPS